MSFKVILVVVLTGFVFYVLMLPRRVALRKALIVLCASVMLLFAVVPDLSTILAHQVGIGRGADFLFYIAFLLLFFVTFVFYLKFKVLEARFTRLVRHLAIVEAEHGQASVAPGTPPDA